MEQVMIQLYFDGTNMNIKATTNVQLKVNIWTEGILNISLLMVQIDPTSDNWYDLGTSSLRWNRHAYTGDLNLSNEGSK